MTARRGRGPDAARLRPAVRHRWPRVLAGWRGRPAPDSRRRLQLALAAVWLLDAALQCQPFMFSGAFGQMLAGTAQGNPAVVAGPVTWSAGIVGQHPAATNAAFATLQLLLALGLAWRPAVKVTLAASVAWSL